VAAQIVLPPQAFLTIIWELFLKFFRIFIYIVSGRGAAVGVAALTTADNDFICVPNGRRWQVSKKRRKDDKTNSQNFVLQINIAHIWRGWLGSVDGSMECTCRRIHKRHVPIVWATMCWMCAITDILAKDCSPTIHAMSMWLHL